MIERPERELASDLAEVAIDAVLKDGLLKDIPIVGTLIKLAKLTTSIPDRIFAAKVSRFVSALSRISKPDTEAFIGEMATDHDRRIKLSEVLTLTLDRIDDLAKADYIAYTFIAYVERMIDLEDLRRCLHSIAEAFESDLADFVQFMVTKAKHPLYIPMNLRGLASTAFAYISGAIDGKGGGPVPHATDLGSKFSKIVAIYRERSNEPFIGTDYRKK